MHPRFKMKAIIPAALMALIPLLLAAGPVGQIKGKVTDAKTGNPLSGASVQVEGLTLGGKTDLGGEFLITGIPEGTYNLILSLIGYERVTVSGVKVSATAPVEVSVCMKQSVLEIGKATSVMGARKGIDFNQTGTVSIGKQKPITLAPVATVSDLLVKESGVTVDAQGELRVHRPGCQSPRKPQVIPYYYAPGFPPAHGGTAIVNGEAYDAMFFENYGVNPFVDTEDDHLSTFAIDVDDASYVMTRSYLERGTLPPDDAVRVEEFVNHFDYEYDPPYDRPFTVYIEGSPSPFGQNCHLLRIGIKGMEIPPDRRKPANLVFVIDVSGSMGREDRLGLVKQALRLLVEELKESDRIGIVAYSNDAYEVLPPTSIVNRQRILNAIEWLQPTDATNAEAGLDLGYAMADRAFEKWKINRIILCSDGVANVGQTGPAAILERIKRFAERGITLSTVGFGMGNYNDVLMEKLGNKGNGRYAYVDDIDEARRIFVDNLTGNLQVIARDVKIQVDFNPDVVRSYRLLGYENRDVADDQFRDDQEDGGEIGAGHSVTALYEIKFNRNRESNTVATVFIRHKQPDTFEVAENSCRITALDFVNRFETCSPQFRLAAAAAEFAEILRKSYWAKGSSLADVRAVVKDVYRDWDSDDILDLMQLVSKAERIEESVAGK